MRPSAKNLTGVRNLLRAKSQVARQLRDVDLYVEHSLSAKVPDRSKHLMLPVWLWIFFLMLFFGVQSASAQMTWSMGYYYPQGTGGYPLLSTLDWSALTHVIVEGSNINADGSITEPSGFASEVMSLISAAHTNNVMVLYGLGSSGAGNIQSAVTNHESTLLTNIMSTVNTYGFDGVDIDYEETWNATVITTLVSDLRTDLGTNILTAATTLGNYATWGFGSAPACQRSGSGWTSAQVAYLNRLSLMTYDLGNPGNPVTWFNTALYSPPGQYLWSIQNAVTAALDCGFPASKLNIGIPFYGDLITANTGPYETNGSGATFTQQGYNYIAANYNIRGATYDTTTHAAWLTVSGTYPTTGSGTSYVNWNSPQSMTDDVNFVKANGLGGWVIWTLGSDYLPSNSPADPLLDAIGKAFRRPAPPTAINATVQ
jgi:chitinase